MPDELDSRIERWDRTALTGTPYADLLRLVEYLHDKRYYQYLPTVGPFPGFFERLSQWIAQVDSPLMQKALLNLVPYILFVGQEEFALLYRAAFRGPITRWLCSVANVDLESPDASQLISTELLEHTWYCPITDSMNINAFHHVNRIERVQARPDWASLARFGNKDKIHEFMQKKGLSRLVLLEDFVGTGTQMRKAVEFAATQLPDVPILLCPLIVADKGNSVGNSLPSKYSNLLFKPVFTLRSHHGAFISPHHKDQRAQWHRILRIVGNLSARLADRIFPQGFPPDWGPWGYKDSGTIVVMYSNTPNNSVPMLHVDGGDHWTALFPRSKRV